MTLEPEHAENYETIRQLGEVAKAAAWLYRRIAEEEAAFTARELVQKLTDWMTSTSTILELSHQLAAQGYQVPGTDDLMECTQECVVRMPTLLRNCLQDDEGLSD